MMPRPVAHAYWSHLLLVLLHVLPLVTAGAFGAQRPEDPDSPIVRIDSGLLRGSSDGEVDKFLGIPYSKPLLGNRRWTPPTRPESWSAIRNATSFSLACAQRGTFYGDSSEDCLYLNVYRPAASTQRRSGASERLPVLFFIHGGSFRTGGANFAVYDGSSLVKRHAGHIVVTTNYRLDALGFLGSRRLAGRHGASPHEQASRPTDRRRPLTANWGLLDQIAALQWVQRNSRAFGGDPKNVLLYGHSAGGWSVASLLVTPQSAGLFHKAVLLSGAFAGLPMAVSQPGRKPRGAWEYDAESDFDLVVSGTSCASLNGQQQQQQKRDSSTSDNDGDDDDDDDDEVPCVHANADPVVACLRALPATEILQAARQLSRVGPVIDGVLLSHHLRQLLEAGRVRDVPVIAGSTHDEGTQFASGLSRMANESALGAWVLAQHGRETGGAALPLYPPRDYPLPNPAWPQPWPTTAWRAGAAITGDFVFSAPARALPRVLAAQRARGARRSPAWLYHFHHQAFFPAVVPGFNIHDAKAHSTDLPFWFGFAPFLFTEEERALAVTMQDALLTFADSSRPPEALGWPVYTVGADTGLKWAAEVDGGVTTLQGWRARLLDFWDRRSTPPPIPARAG